ncbi:MAG: Fe-S cluster assembly protein SufB [candidate division KSB1 bacterium]|nr:Fe-S cluster assembly protein SufB [candidate division KSB1 bacterium]MDZ7304984.1 Fe-S cluster assembly protein SufB [candidate division KSB1 bacterium]MDZ7314027.1 Fe-S cluster assembly protein SufB [candidate division KSB1 bacterium]
MIQPEVDREVMIKEENPHFSRKNVEAIAEWKAEPDWMRARRLELFELFRKLPMPGRKDEDWRRTDISALEYTRYLPFEPIIAPPVKSFDELPDLVRRAFDAESEVDNLIVNHNGQRIFRQTTSQIERAKVIFTDLDDAVRRYPELVQQYFMQSGAQAQDEKFVALHGAFWNGGTFLYVPRNVKVEAPIRSFNVLSRSQAASFDHVLIIVEEGAEITFFEENVSAELNQQAFSNSVVEIFVKPGAKLQFISLQNHGHTVYNFSHKRALIERDATMNWLVGTFGSRLSKSVIGSIMVGPGSSTEMLGLSFGDSDQVIDQNTLQIHQAPHTKSDLLFKTALKERSRSIYKGTIHVVHGAQKADAYQANRNLVLGRQARADSIPGLEIEANDVRCTHGATVGTVDEEQLFYLMSRGLSRDEAVKIIVDGFFEPVLRRIPDERVVARLRETIEAKTATIVL